MNFCDMELYLEMKRKIQEAAGPVADLTIFHAALGRFPSAAETRQRLQWTRDRLQQLVAQLDAILQPARWPLSLRGASLPR